MPGKSEVTQEKKFMEDAGGDAAAVLEDALMRAVEGGGDEAAPEAGPTALERALADMEHQETGGGEAAPGQKVTLKYNGEERQLPLEEVIVLAQKGLNYDKVKARADGAGGRETQVLEALGEQLGLPPGEAADLLEEVCLSMVAGELAGQGVPEDLARQMAGTRLGVAAEDGGDEEEKEGPGGFLELAEKYPDLTELPEEAGVLIEEGVPPLYAYEMAENRRLKEEMDALGAKEKNARQAPGSAASTGEGETQDPFLRGFAR